MKKKLLAIVLTTALAVTSLVGCGAKTDSGDAAAEGGAEAADYSVAMITDYGDITDQSFNQTTYEACKAFCEEHGIEFNYYKPSGDSTAERVASVEKAIDEGHNVIVMTAQGIV